MNGDRRLMGKKKSELDPRQAQTLANYLDPKSKTFGNLTQSAIKAGYTLSYADNLTSLAPEWLSGNIGRAKMVAKAERNLDEFLDMDIKNVTVTKNGTVVEQDDVGKLKIKQDTSKFVAERLNKTHYSSRTETDVTDRTALDEVRETLKQLANEQDTEISIGAVSGSGRETVDTDTEAIDDLRSDIQEAISKSSPDVSHTVREVPGGGSGGADEGDDIS